MNNAVKLQILPSGVAVITLDTPDSKVNVLSSALMAELSAALDEVAVDARVKGLVIISAKEDNFVAGANLDEILEIQRQPSVVAFRATQEGKAIFAKIENMPFETVAAINGSCLGGGLELSLACDWRIVTNSPKTKLGLPEVGLGFLPGWGGTVRSVELLGAEAAMELILQPLKSWDAGKAYRSGLAHEVVAPDQLLARAEYVALTGLVRPRLSLKKRLRKLALEGNPLGRKILFGMATKAVYAETRGKYPAPPAALKVIQAALTGPRAKAFELESSTFASLAVTPESKSLVSIFFATQESKKAPQNARPTIEIKTVGVLGAGVMGGGIAQAAAYSEYKVVLYDKFPQGLEKGRATIKELFDGLVEKRKLTQEESDAMFGNIVFTTEYAPLADVDMVVEAIVEDLGVKVSGFKAVEDVVRAKHGNKRFIRASNTSSLKVTLMAAASDEPELYGGLHFFNPVHKMPLVEIVSAEKTAPDTVAALKGFAQKLGKTTVTTADSPGFAVNRILTPYLCEAIRMAEDGVPLEDIERAIKSFGFPMGPFELLDTVGLDIVSKVTEVMAAALGSRVAPSPVILPLIKAQKLLGKKGGKGLYLYDANGKKTGFNPDIIAAINKAPKRKSPGEIQDRLVFAMLNEAVLCLEEGVMTEPSQLDLACVMGMGFPPFRGGIIRYADSLGWRAVHQKLSDLSQVAGDNYRPAKTVVEAAKSGKTFTK